MENADSGLFLQIICRLAEHLNLMRHKITSLHLFVITDKGKQGRRPRSCLTYRKSCSYWTTDCQRTLLSSGVG